MEKQELEKKFKELKAIRRKEKEEWRTLLPEFIEEFNKVKNQFLKIDYNPMIGLVNQEP